MCCEGKEIDFKELKSPEMEALQKALFPGIISMLQQGPQMPPTDMPINAPNDPNFAMGMNMFREMGGQSPNYTPYQAPQYWNPAWTPNWGNFPGYSADNSTFGGDYGTGGGGGGDKSGRKSSRPNKSDRDKEIIGRDKNPGK